VTISSGTGKQRSIIKMQFKIGQLVVFHSNGSQLRVKITQKQQQQNLSRTKMCEREGLKEFSKFMCSFSTLFGMGISTLAWFYPLPHLSWILATLCRKDMDFRVAMALVGMSSSSAIKQSAAVPVGEQGVVELVAVVVVEEKEERATFILAMFTDALCRTASTYAHIINQYRLYTHQKEEKGGGGAHTPPYGFANMPKQQT
jgi:hypothetical protein